jgi:hypothetical protein
MGLLLLPPLLEMDRTRKITRFEPFFGQVDAWVASNEGLGDMVVVVCVVGCCFAVSIQLMTSNRA